jgi:hypothetical protein
MYLENTQSNICFVGCLNYDIQLHEFIDSDWAGSVDDRRSATRICFSLNFSKILWDCRKQSSVSLKKQSILQLVMLVQKQYGSVSWFLDRLIRC